MEGYGCCCSVRLWLTCRNSAMGSCISTYGTQTNGSLAAGLLLVIAIDLLVHFTTRAREPCLIFRRAWRGVSEDQAILLGAEHAARTRCVRYARFQSSESYYSSFSSSRKVRLLSLSLGHDVRHIHLHRLLGQSYTSLNLDLRSLRRFTRDTTPPTVPRGWRDVRTGAG